MWTKQQISVMKQKEPARKQIFYEYLKAFRKSYNLHREERTWRIQLLYPIAVRSADQRTHLIVINKWRRCFVVIKVLLQNPWDYSQLAFKKNYIFTEKSLQIEDVYLVVKTCDYFCWIRAWFQQSKLVWLGYIKK